MHGSGVWEPGAARERPVASTLWGGSLYGGYTAAVYNKGPYAFHVMRMTWGDEKFFRFLKMLAQELTNRAIVRRDIQKIAEKAFGGSLDFFFDQWLRGVGMPEFTLTYTVRATEDGAGRAPARGITKS